MEMKEHNIQMRLFERFAVWLVRESGVPARTYRSVRAGVRIHPAPT